MNNHKDSLISESHCSQLKQHFNNNTLNKRGLLSSVHCVGILMWVLLVSNILFSFWLYNIHSVRLDKLESRCAILEGLKKVSVS